MNARADAGGPDPSPAGWRIVLALALIGAALGFGWGIADQPRWRASATVAVESDSQGSDRARLERFAQRGESEQVATRAAVLLGNDVPGADLLADVTVRPAPQGGFVVVTATADAPDVAAAAADGFQRALVDVEGEPLALGSAATIPGSPTGDRPAALWAAIGLIAGALAGLLVAAVLRLLRHEGGRHPRGTSPAEALEDRADAGSTSALAGRLGAGVAELDPGPDGPIVGSGNGAGLAVAPAAAPAVAELAGRLGVVGGAGPGSIALTAIGPGADPLGVAAALAIAATEAGLRALVVDADLGRPGLARRLGVEPAPGLHDYLEGRAGPREVLRGVAVAGGEGFAAVPAGSPAPGATVAGSRFAALVSRLGRAYDVVLYASPPILGSEDADAVVGLVDEVVLLVGPDPSPADLDRAAELLAGTPVTTVAATVG